MSESFVFDPRHEACKTPFGAVVCGQTITFNCRPLISEGFSHCSLVLHHEFSNITKVLEMTPVGPDGDRFRFTLDLPAPAEPELSWYHFHFWRDNGTGCDLDKTGYRSDGSWEPWQLTTYRESLTPQWFGNGVTYQIFPDRFHRLSVPSPDGLVGDRWVHENWNELPAWKPDEDGEIRNRDFFGGSLAGITAKLDDLAAMGVTTLYFCPIFESASNHRYNTANYQNIDPMLGSEEDFRMLCDAAHEHGMKVMLDGVFNHTGSQSIYFNADGFYPSLGAAQSQGSPYFGWFTFHPWPEDYESWWGIKTLPAVREDTESYIDYIIEGDDSIIRRWIRAGADGWRLDVADELPDRFIEKIRAAVQEEKPDAFLLGEVWEDASNKIAYDQRRKYLLGSELHGVMNYPFRTALLDWLKGGNAADFLNAMETLRENYPTEAFYSAMNFLGTHDTPRILTVLAAADRPEEKDDRAVYRLTPQQRQYGLSLVKLAALVLFSFPGSPTVYYGDEAGMEGWEDPFNRGTYPWGSENTDLKARFSLLGNLRRQYPALQRGDLFWLAADGALLAYSRTLNDQRIVCAVNAGSSSRTLTLDWPGETALDLLTGRQIPVTDGTISLLPYEGLLLI